MAGGIGTRMCVGLMAMGLSGCQVPAGPERALSGQDIYQRHCARCHGPDGKGTAAAPGARDLSNAAYMATRSDDQLRGAIMQGIAPNMPAFGGQFLEPSMKVLVAYVRGFASAGTAGAAGESAASAAAPADDGPERP